MTKKRRLHWRRFRRYAITLDDDTPGVMVIDKALSVAPARFRFAVYRESETGEQVAFATWLDRDAIASIIQQWVKT